MSENNYRFRSSEIPGEGAAASGQAMVEFLFMLMILMALCTGMILCLRLLTFQFWAQQEARFVAFEQVWPQHSRSGDPLGEPIVKLQNGGWLRRPEMVSNLDADKSAHSDGSISDLFPLWARADTQRSPSAGGDDSSPLIMLASRGSSIWHRRTSEWFSGDEDEDEEGWGLSLVDTAFASQNRGADRRRGDQWPDDEDIDDRELLQIEDIFVPRRKLDHAFIKTVRELGFGEKLCPALAAVMMRHENSVGVGHFSDPRCADRYNVAFGVHLGESVRLKEFFRTYGYRLEWGFEPAQALETTVTDEVTNQFYSFFDDIVRATQQGTVQAFMSARIGHSTYHLNPAIQRMINEARYVGSRVAVSNIVALISHINTESAWNRSYLAEKNLEDAINHVLHAEADEGIPGVTNDFSLPITMLPIPPDLHMIAGGLQSGLMKNVLTRDSHLFDPLIDESNKTIQVTYSAERGIFPAARRNIDTEGIQLTGKFYLVTQPWHITRRTSPLGGWRAKGSQRDSMSDNTYEGILRRRVFGLWAYPKRPVELLDPITQIPELRYLDVALEPFRYVEGALSEVMAFMLDNPLIDVADALSEIPGIGQFVPTLPKWPAVRPDAYPGSTELRRDRLMTGWWGGTRNFQNYINEQRDFAGRAANPSFN